MSKPRKERVSWQLFVGTTGVVYGDIGTSPLYTIRSVFSNKYLQPPESVDILGVASLIFWALLLIVCIKYLLIIMRADNKGEGGIFALVALLRRCAKSNIRTISILGVLGAALLFGDGVITPAISVLGAVEGLQILSPTLDTFIVPVSVILILSLFMLQTHGTTKIGKFFGPIMITWFISIAMFGLPAIIAQPQILSAINPWYAFKVIEHSGATSLYIIGAVVLAITGVEALYADMGHFNKFSIRLSWFALVYPCLLINYFGQCALLLANPLAVINPFYMLVPQTMLIPMIVLATIASIIASQAVITGIFSLTSQAILLGFMPRMKIVHTSLSSHGQVFIPFTNGIALILTIISVILFQSSESLASAYGVTITLIMLITTILTIILAYKVWHWHILKIIAIFTGFIAADLLFVISNSIKLASGALYPLTIAGGLGIVMYTWFKGRNILHKQSIQHKTLLLTFADRVTRNTRHRIFGTAVYLSRTPGYTPQALALNVKHSQSLHETVLILSIAIKNIPTVRSAKRIRITAYNNGIFQVKAYYGFMDIPNVSKIIKQLHNMGLSIPDDTPFFLSHNIPVPSRLKHLHGWAEKLFIFLFHNSASPTDFFRLPDKKVIEVGTRVLV